MKTNPDQNLPTIGDLRVTTLELSDEPQRRRKPRRRLVSPVPTDRRRADRRQASPGVDGLLRTVLADEWNC